MTALPLTCHAHSTHSFSSSSSSPDMQSPYSYTDSPYSSSPGGMDFFFYGTQQPLYDPHTLCDSPFPMSDVLPEPPSFPSSFTSSPYMIPPMSEPGPIYDPSTMPTGIHSSASSSCGSYTSHVEEVPMSSYPLAQEDSHPDSPSQAKPSKPFGCDNCGKSFTRFADLKRHQSSVHYPVFRNCPVEHCSRKGSNGFPRQDHLVEHLRSYHHLDVPKRRAIKRGKDLA